MLRSVRPSRSTKPVTLSWAAACLRSATLGSTGGVAGAGPAAPGNVGVVVPLAPGAAVAPAVELTRSARTYRPGVDIVEDAQELRRWRLYTYAGDIIEHRNITWSVMFGDALNRAGLKVKGLTK